MIAVLLAATLAAPLSPGDALTLLTTTTMPPAIAKLDARCKKAATVILTGSVDDVRKLLSRGVGCATPRYPKLANAIDAHAIRCATTEPEACESWIVHARAALLDAHGEDSNATNVARLTAALAALGVGDMVDRASATRAVVSSVKLSDDNPESAPVQRLVLAGRLLLNGDDVPDNEASFAALVPRVLRTNADDTEVWGAFIYLAERAKLGDSAKQYTETLIQGATSAGHKATAYYLRGCLAVHENDMAGARDYFTNAAKADPFDARYKQAANDAAAGKRFQCKVVMTPFAPALRRSISDTQ